MMSLVRLLGFTTLGCGCVTGHYREVATNREITYVEEKGRGCQHHAHRRNHTLTTSAFRPRGSGCKSVVSVPSRNTVDWCAMPRSGARTATPSVHTTVRTARSDPVVLPGRLPGRFASLPAASVSVIVTSPPYNLGIEYRSYDDSCRASEYLQWTEHGPRRRRACSSLTARCS